MIRAAAEPIADLVQARIVELGDTLAPVTVEQAALATIVGAARGLTEVSTATRGEIGVQILAALRAAGVIPDAFRH